MIAREWLNRLGPLLGLAAVLLLFVILGPAGFSTLDNFKTMAIQTVVVGLAALGMTLVIISGGIDLSAGSVVALVSVVTATLLGKSGWPPLASAAAGVLAGTLCGAANGALVAGVRLVPFIVTLGTLLIVRGAAKGLGREEKVNAPVTWLNDLIAALPESRRWMIVPPGVWMLLGLALGVGALLRYTRLGRHIFAVGSNEQAARLCGVPVGRVKLSVYALGGFFSGLAGVLQFARLRVGDPVTAEGLELDVIAAVVIGGGSLAGGEGSVFGSLVGALTMTVIRTGCNLMDISTWVQNILTGAIILAAATLDRLRRR